MQPNGQHYTGGLIGKTTFEVRPEGEDGPVYHMRMPSLDDRFAFDERVRRAVRKAAGADADHKIGELGLLDELEAGLKRIVEEEEGDPELAAQAAGQWFPLIAEHRERLEAFDREAFGEDGWWNEATAEERRRRRDEAVTMPPELRRIVEFVEDEDEGFADAVMADKLYNQIRAAQVARQFLASWEGVDLPGRPPIKPHDLRRGKRPKREVEEETLLALAQNGHLAALYVAFMERLSPGQARLKNSRRPSSGDSSGMMPSSERSTSPPNGHATTPTEYSTDPATDSPASS